MTSPFATPVSRPKPMAGSLALALLALVGGLLVLGGAGGIALFYSNGYAIVIGCVGFVALPVGIVLLLIARSIHKLRSR